MSNLVLVLILLAVVGLAFQLGLRNGRGHHVNGVRMHSRPVYHGALVALWCAVPAFIVLSAWMLFERPLVESLALANVPDAAVATEQLRLVLLRRIEALASGFGVTGHVEAFEVAAAERLSQLRARSGLQERLAELTDRERDVMDLVVAGLPNKLIADQLDISVRTVEVHRSRVFDKMQVKSAVELANLLRTEK